jgi:Holliday junction resolvasome RuvABC endonuclease subunit
MRIQGWDIAPNHAGFVEIEDGHVLALWYYTTLVEAAKRGKDHAEKAPTLATKDLDERSLLRTLWVEDFIKRRVLPSKPDFIGIEGYALEGGNSPHYTGELGGAVRRLAYGSGAKVRIVDPMTVKMFAAHNGAAKKPQVRAAILERWGLRFNEFDPPKKKNAKNQNTTTSEDLCDAYAIAKFVSVEIELRAGRITLSDLHAKEIQCFNRVTKAYPVNLLGREWLWKGEA